MAENPDELTVTVSAKDIYDGVKRLEAKLDALPTADHETRIRGLERWRYGTGAALVASVVGLISKWKGHA